MSKELQKIQILCNPELSTEIAGFFLFMSTEKQYAQHTINSYLLDLKDFFVFVKNQNNKNQITIEDLDNVNLTFVRKWLGTKISTGGNISSNNRYISSLKTFFSYLKNNDSADNAVFDKISHPKKQKPLPKSLTEEQTFLVLDKVKDLNTQKWKNARDYSIVLIMCSIGLRISEVLSISANNIEQNKGFLRIIGKRNKERITPLPKLVYESIMEYIKLCPYNIKHNEGIFFSDTGKPYTSRLIQKYFEKLRNQLNLPDYVTPHAMRHTCATLLLQNNENNDALRKIQRLLGHNSLSTTQIYTKITNKGIKNALNNLNYWEN